MSVLFHHSSLGRSPRLERRLSHMLTTLRVHGIHHSTVPSETDSNGSSVRSLGDHLHRALRLDVPDRRVQVGMPAHRDPSSIRLDPSLAMPFLRQCDAWQGQPGRFVRA